MPYGASLQGLPVLVATPVPGDPVPAPFITSPPPAHAWRGHYTIPIIKAL